MSTSATNPPPIRASRGKLALLFSAALFVAVLLVVVVVSIDRQTQMPDEASTRPDVQDLVPPSALDTADQTTGIRGIDDNPDLIAARQGYIQVTDPGTGRLSQQYRWSQSSPLPDGQLKLQQPVVELYLSDERLITLQGDEALVRAPNRALESGVIRGGPGEVIIRLYEIIDGQPPDLSTDKPVMEVRTDEASFDNVQGEVKCPREVDIQTENAHLPGTNLRLQINEMEKRAEWLRMESVGLVRVRSLESSPAARTAATKPATSRPAKPASRPSASRPAKPAGSTAQGPTFYQLTFSRNVRIEQGRTAEAWRADGDDLHLIFSVEGDTLTAKVASDSSGSPTSNPGWSTTTILAGLSLAAIQPAGPLFVESDEDIIITCDGGLTMVPLQNRAKQPKSADDARFELVGSPVKLRQESEQLDIQCASLSYQTLSQRMELNGDASHPLDIRTPQLHAVGEQFWINRVERTGGFTSGGRLTLMESSSASDSPANDSLSINWTDGVNLMFAAQQSDAAAADFGALKGATFLGGVNVASADVQLDAKAMEVGFAESGPDQQAEDRIDFIDASGSVQVQGSGQDGRITSDRLRVAFQQNPAGKTVPVRMDATGNVAAIDPDQQTIWSDVLAVTFRALTEEETAAGGEGANNRRRNVDADTIIASGNVQVLMPDGARAFAETLNADARQEVAVLSSVADPGVMIVSGPTILQGGKRLEIRKADGRAMWPGAGEFLQMPDPIIAIEPGRVSPPVIDIETAVAEVRARWNDSMVYDSRINDGAGAITLKGAVAAASTPTPLEQSTMTSRELTLEFELEPGHATTTQPAASQPDDQDVFGSSSRRLRRFIARGEAELESHAWQKEDHSDASRVFFVSGDHIQHDGRTLESEVRGPGQLMVRDERPDPAAATQPANPASPMSFSARGTTMFTWKSGLNMNRLDDQRLTIIMDGGVDVRHQAIDKTISTMTGDRLEAEVVKGVRVDPNDVAEASLNLGGNFELKKLRGVGRIFINTPTRDVQCDQFEYDYDTGLASLEAGEGRTVTMTTTTTIQPIKARSIVWNLREDRIVATNVSGVGGR